MPSIHNRKSCFNCGAPVHPGNYVYLGNCRVWVCEERECNRELDREAKATDEQEREEALRAVAERYRLW